MSFRVSAASKAPPRAGLFLSRFLAGSACDASTGESNAINALCYAPRNMKYTAPTRHRDAHRKSHFSSTFM